MYIKTGQPCYYYFLLLIAWLRSQKDKINFYLIYTSTVMAMATSSIRLHVQRVNKPYQKNGTAHMWGSYYFLSPPSPCCLQFTIEIKLIMIRTRRNGVLPSLFTKYGNFPVKTSAINKNTQKTRTTQEKQRITIIQLKYDLLETNTSPKFDIRLAKR